jgi:hypothetical protein
VSSADRRLTKIENRCGQSREVSRILGVIRRVNDEKLYWLNKSGQLVQMAEHLSYRELHQLITELKAMLEEA